MKAPNHLMTMDALLEVFPGAEFIFIHRRLSQTLASLISLIQLQVKMFGGTSDDKTRRR